MRACSNLEWALAFAMGLQTSIAGTPRGDQGDGWRLVVVPRHAQPVLVLEYGRLAREIRDAVRYSRANGGDLPATPYWNQVASSYAANPALFRATHGCETLLALVRRDALHDSRVQPLPEDPPPEPTDLPSVPIGPDTSTDTGTGTDTGTTGDTPSVPEPLPTPPELPTGIWPDTSPGGGDSTGSGSIVPSPDPIVSAPEPGTGYLVASGLAIALIGRWWRTRGRSRGGP